MLRSQNPKYNATLNIYKADVLYQKFICWLLPISIETGICTMNKPLTCRSHPSNFMMLRSAWPYHFHWGICLFRSKIGRSQSLEIMVWTSAGKLLEVKVVAPYYPWHWLGFTPIFYLSIVFWLIPALNFSTMELDDSLFAPSCAGGEKALDSVMEQMADTAPCYTFIGWFYDSSAVGNILSYVDTYGPENFTPNQLHFTPNQLQNFSCTTQDV